MVVLIEGQRVYAWVHAQRLGDRDSLACALCQPAAHHPADYVVLLLPVCLDILLDDLLLFDVVFVFIPFVEAANGNLEATTALVLLVEAARAKLEAFILLLVEISQLLLGLVELVRAVADVILLEVEVIKAAAIFFSELGTCCCSRLA